MQLQEEAVLSGDPVALRDLRDLARELPNPLEPAGRRRDANDRRDRIADGARVDAGVVAGDHARTLETLDALGDRGRRKRHAPTELGDRQPCIRLKLLEDSPVDRVDPLLNSGHGCGTYHSSTAERRERLRSRIPVAAQPRDDRRVTRGFGYFVGSAVFHYLGPSFAVLLFTRVEPLGVAWLRIGTAAAVYALWRRPWRAWALASPAARRTVGAMGVVLGLMNPCFYLAIARLPLATVAAIEFVPVLALAALGARSSRNAAALVTAGAGVYLLTDVRLEGQPLGFAFAFVNAALFALYIALAHRVSRLDGVTGIDGVAAAMLVALVVATPLGGSTAMPTLVEPVVLAAGIGVGVTSSVVPYVCDQLAMARMPRATYALCVALLPATAAVVGVVVLRQIPSASEVAAILLVVAGVALHREAAQE
jgi:inner membrane transporter RhtA